MQNGSVQAPAPANGAADEIDDHRLAAVEHQNRIQAAQFEQLCNNIAQYERQRAHLIIAMQINPGGVDHWQQINQIEVAISALGNQVAQTQELIMQQVTGLWQQVDAAKDRNSVLEEQAAQRVQSVQNNPPEILGILRQNRIADEGLLMTRQEQQFQQSLPPTRVFDPNPTFYTSPRRLVATN